MDILLMILAGAGVGLAVGITGVGGGSLMTPILLLFGVPLHIAVGTDLVYAAITKSTGSVLHARQKSVEWRLVVLMTAGSVPAALCTVAALAYLFDSPEEYGSIIRMALGVMLIVTALLLLGARRTGRVPEAEQSTHRGQDLATLLMGAVLGVAVTLSSVGAAAVATAVLMVLYPHLPALRILGTNMVHAVPLTLVAGLGHIYLGNIDYILLICLLAGSIPAIYLGTRIATRMPNRFLQPILASILLAVGIKFAFF